MTPAVRRAAGLVVIGLVVAVTCTFLGRWQWHRHVVKDRLIAVVQANWAAAPVPLTTLAPPGASLTPASEWRSVRVEGHYVPAATVLLRNRPVASHSAYHVLVPFVAQDGSVLVVDRGWVPMGSNGSTAATPGAPPAGTTTLVGRVRMPEAASTRGAPPGQVQSIDVPQVLAAAGSAAPAGTAYPFYVAVSTEDPAPPQPLGTLDPPDTDPGPHLSYAFQWWVFALGGFAACVWSARRELVEERQERGAAGARRVDEVDGPAAASTPLADGAGRDGTSGPTTGALQGSGGADEGRPARGPSPERSRRRPGRDELAEDALVDAQLGGGSPGAAPGRPEDAAPR